MKCSEAEQLILLYPELTQIEKSGVDEHINRCARCLELFKQQSMYRQVLNQAKTQVPQIQNYARLTSRIMSRIHPAAHSTNWLEHIIAWTRVPVTVMALVLIVAGFVEFQEATVNTKNWISGDQTSQASIHHFFRDYPGKSKPASLYQSYRSKNWKSIKIN